MKITKKKKIIDDSICISRIWNNGLDKRCKRSSIFINSIGGFCKTHYEMYTICVHNNCKRGSQGLGGCWICKQYHIGLWLGVINKKRPIYNQQGIEIPFKKPFLYMKIKTPKIKNKKSKIKTNHYNSIKMYSKQSRQQVYLVLYNTMNSLDLDNSSCTPEYIINMVEKNLKHKLKIKDKKHWIYSDIEKIYDLKIKEEFTPSSDEDNSLDSTEALDKFIMGGKEYLIDTETYKVFTSSKKPLANTISRTAFPTDIAKGFPPKVLPCVPGTMPIDTFFVTKQAPSGKPPPIPFAIGTMSGIIPDFSNAKKLPVL